MRSYFAERLLLKTYNKKGPISSLESYPFIIFYICYLHTLVFRIFTFVVQSIRTISARRPFALAASCGTFHASHSATIG